MLLLKEGKGLNVACVDAAVAKVLLDENRWKIARELAKAPSYPAELAKRLRMNEQIVYYHIRNLEAAGLIKLARTEERQGAVAKYYRLIAPAFAVVAKEDWREGNATEKKVPRVLDGFIENGKLNCKIIVGSPDPHGPNKARARDCYFGLDLALLLGSYCGEVKAVTKLDTEIREADLEDNIICIGGPLVNLITGRFIEKMPVRFQTHDHWAIISEVSGSEYIEDTIGLITRIENPLKRGKQVLVVAGKGIEGTRAAVIALVKHAEKLGANLHDKKVPANVVEGVDLDGDGIVDDVEIRE